MIHIKYGIDIFAQRVTWFFKFISIYIIQKIKGYLLLMQK